MWGRWIAAALALLLWAGQAQAVEKRVALVIGNAAYQQGPLRNPVNDARAMAATLRQTGFQVIARENATKQQMERAVGEFSQALTPGSVALFYYAGHGMQVNGSNFLVPVDAKVVSEQMVRLETLDVDVVLDQIAASGSNVNLVILDACRNNPFERRFRSTGGGLAQINAPKGTLIAYATAPGKVAADGDAQNGLYTEKLIKVINTPGIPLEEVFKRVRIEVSRESNDAQTPWEASSLVGNFYFMGPTTVTVNPPANPTVDRDALHWQSVWDSKDPAQVQTYLDQYPKGAFAGLAQKRLAALRLPPPQPSASPQAAPGASSAFDGTWEVTIDCPRHTDGTKGYGYKFPAEVKNGVLHGERKSATTEASLAIDGIIQPDGTATLHAAVVTGNEEYTVSRLRQGSKVRYTIKSRFAAARGVGNRVEGRSCNFTFVRQ